MSNREAAAASERPLPCPFCGGTAECFGESLAHGVSCTSCRARISGIARDVYAGIDELRGALLKAWNTRAASAPQAVPVAAQPAASGVDAAMELADEYAIKHALHVQGRASMTAAVDAREALRAHLSTALTGAQPAPAAPSGYKLVPLEPTEAMSVEGFSSDAWGALRTAVSRNKGWPYSCNEAAGCVEGIYRAMISAAPAAQPADSAMEVLIELVAIQDLKKKHAIAAYMANTQVGQLQRDGLAECDRLSTELARIEKPAWDRARALTAASKERRQG